MFCQNDGLPREMALAETGVTRFCRSVRRSVTQYFIATSAMVSADVLRNRLVDGLGVAPRYWKVRVCVALATV